MSDLSINDIEPFNPTFENVRGGTTIGGADIGSDLTPTIVDETLPVIAKICTIAFSEDKNRWTTFYSFQPDLMISNNVGFYSWKGGKLYQHEKGVYNTFYDTLYPSEIDVVSNENPSNVKFYKAIFSESNLPVNIEATNQNSQKTSLLTTDFEEKEGVYYAAFLKDENTPNVSQPLLEGDDMRCHSMTIKTSITTNEYFRMFSMGIHSELSELTNR